MNAQPTRSDPHKDAVLVERARRRTLEFARWRNRKFTPTAGGFHHRLATLCDEITDSAERGRGRWVVINAPPRHGKSELVGRCMPARAMLRTPGFSVLYATSTDDRAREVSQRVRASCERLAAMGVKHLAPGRIWTDREFETVGGNVFVSVGMGAATGGIGAHLIIPDDVTGSGKRAGSAAFRRDYARWFEEDVLTRAMDNAAIVNMETRRGPSDGSAWFAERFGDRVEVHAYRCVAEGDDWRRVGDHLWPEKFGPEWLAQNPHLAIGGRVWETLYQQRPTAVEGEAIKRDWFRDRRYRENPRDILARATRVVIAVDCASSPDSRADWTVMQAWAQVGDDLYLLVESRGQWGINEQEDALRALVAAWPHRARSVVIERSSNGIALQQRTAVTLGSVSVTTATKDREDATAATAKERRAYEFIAAARALRVCVPVGPMGDAVIDEWVSLGTDAPDDRLDAAAHAVNELAATAIPLAPRLRNPDRLRGLAV